MKPFDINGALQHVVPEEVGGLRRLAARGVAATLLSGGMALGIQLVSAVVLARLLSPRDFGLVTIVTTFSLLFMNFGLNGITEAIIHREDVNHRQATNLFWINVAGSTLLAIGFAASGFLLARFFGDRRVAGVAAWMALTIFLTGLSVVHLALLKRTMRFSVVSANDMFARAFSVLVSICLGWAGWGYWALVVGAISLSASTCVGAWSLCIWMPGVPRRAAGTGSMVRYAISAYGRFFTGYFTNNLDNFLVGWRLGPMTLGFYKKAYDLFGISSNQLASGLTIVAVSALSRMKQNAEQYRSYLLGALGVMAFIGMGISAELTLVGKDLILVLLGPNWSESGRLFTIFAPGIGFMLLYFTQGWIHLSLGNADRWFRWGMVDLTVTTAFLIAGLHWNAEGIAAAWVASYWVLALPALWYAGRPIQLEISSVLGVIWKYIAASSMAGGAAFLILGMKPSIANSSGPIWAMARLAMGSLLFLVLYVGLIAVLHRGFAPLHQVLGILREMTSRDMSMAPASDSLNETRPSAGSPIPEVAHLGDGTRFASSSQQISKWKAPRWFVQFLEARQAHRDLRRSFLLEQSKCPIPRGKPTAGACQSTTVGAQIPLVSILIPAYNSREWIADAICSAIAQTWPRIEIIVVDDGSTDDTLAIARRSELYGVRVIAQRNQGAASARNAAYSVSKGDYIQWLDADDILAPDKVARQIEAIGPKGNKKTLLSGAFGRFLYRPWEAKFVPTALWCDLSPSEWLHRKLEQNIFMQTGTWLVSRELSEAAGPWDTRLLGDDDGEYFCRVLMASDGVQFVPEAKLYWRSFGYDSLGYIGLSARKCEAHWLSMQLHISYLLSMEDSPSRRAACLRYLRTCLIYFYPERREIVRQVRNMAIRLTGELGEPSLSWKYSWARWFFGWTQAKKLQVLLRRIRWKFTGAVDKAMLQFERQFGLARDKGWMV